jgi:hypothetical protein
MISKRKRIVFSMVVLAAALIASQFYLIVLVIKYERRGHDTQHIVRKLAIDSFKQFYKSEYHIDVELGHYSILVKSINAESLWLVSFASNPRGDGTLRTVFVFRIASRYSVEFDHMEESGSL